jgi:hypothetical protein
MLWMPNMFSPNSFVPSRTASEYISSAASDLTATPHDTDNGDAAVSDATAPAHCSLGLNDACVASCECVRAYTLPSHIQQFPPSICSHDDDECEHDTRYGVPMHCLPTPSR